ncbi:methyltransferase [Nonomuraea glycinis]|uniref:methyltransferase n=1 Tax=Nonomuraea glycinis TaxID=2047744 RepID=UPI0033B6AF1F
MGKRLSVPVGVVGPPEAASLSPQARLLTMTNGLRISHVLHAVTALRIADHLAQGPLPVSRLAEVAECEPDPLGRLLRAAAAVGLFERLDNGEYALTPLSEPLREDVPGSLRDAVLYAGHEMTWRPYGELVNAVRSGVPAFFQVFNTSFYEHGKADPAAGALMNRAMRRLSHTTGRALLDSCDLSRFQRVADLGGGLGEFLVEVLRRNPEAKGVLVDQPDVIEQARRALAETEDAQRIMLSAGDFFTGVPSGCDAYVLKSVLHNWDDQRTGQILRRVREAIGGDSAARLFIFEQLIGPPNQWDNGAFMDLDMMLKFGGRVRDLAQWRGLLEESGFALDNEPRPGAWTVLVWRPC